VYYCQDCEKEFKLPKIIKEDHGQPEHNEVFRVCPLCFSRNIIKRPPRFCKYCGARLYTEGDYCNKRCERLAHEVWERERKRKRDWLASPLYSAIKEVEEYNKTHGTALSYGQYFGVIKNEHK